MRIAILLLVLPILNAACTGDALYSQQNQVELTGKNRISLGSLGLQQEFAISMWVKPAPGETADWAALVDYKHSATKSFAFHQFADKQQHYSFGVHSDKGVNGVYVDLVPSQWQHIILIKSLHNLSLFLNGQRVDTTKIDDDFRLSYAGDESLTIGAWGYGERYWKGSVSCFRVYDYSLDSGMVELLAKQKQCKQ
jgi:hypothetical protein